MVVLEDRQDEGPVVAAAGRVVAVESLHQPPAVVLAPAGAGRSEVDLLPEVLAHVADQQVAGRAVEAPPPRVAQAVGPDLVAAGRAHEGVRPRNRVRSRRGLPAGHRARSADVEAQELAEQDVLVLGVVGRVASRAAVARAHVEVPVDGREHELSAVVVGVGRVGHDQQDRGRRGVGDVGIARDVVPGQRDVAGRRDVVGVVDVEEPVRPIVRIEGHGQQALLRAVGGQRPDVEKRRPEKRAVLDDADRAALRHDENARGVARRVRHLHRLRDAVGDERERDPGIAAEGRHVGRPVGARRGAAGLALAVGRAARRSRDVADQIARGFVETVQGGRVGVGREGAPRPREAARVAQHLRDADLVEEAVVGGMEHRVRRRASRRRGRGTDRWRAAGVASSGYETSPSGPSPSASRMPSTKIHIRPSERRRSTATWCHRQSRTPREPQIVRSPVPSPLTPKTTAPPAIETPNFRSRPDRSRSTTTLPSLHATLAPQATAGAVSSEASAFIQNSIEKSLGADVGRRAGVGVGRIVDRDLHAVDVAGPVARGSAATRIRARFPHKAGPPRREIERSGTRVSRCP